MNINALRANVPSTASRAKSTACSCAAIGAAPARNADQGAMHTESLQAHLALGARSRPRGRATSTRQAAQGHDATQANSRARVRNPQALDGNDALPDAQATQRSNRDEPA